MRLINLIFFVTISGNFRIINCKPIHTDTMAKVKEINQLKAELKKRKQINKAAENYLSEQSEGDLYDAYLKLLEASENGEDNHFAIDYIEVWQPLESYTVAKMIELIENSIESPELPEFVTKIDWDMLKGQKRILLEVINKDELNPEEKEGLEGILSLIDSLQDAAVDEYGLAENLVFDLHPDEE